MNRSDLRGGRQQHVAQQQANQLRDERHCTAPVCLTSLPHQRQRLSLDQLLQVVVLHIQIPRRRRHVRVPEERADPVQRQRASSFRRIASRLRDARHANADVLEQARSSIKDGHVDRPLELVSRAWWDALKFHEGVEWAHLHPTVVLVEGHSPRCASCTTRPRRARIADSPTSPISSTTGPQS